MDAVTEAQVATSFRRFDTDRDGVISKKELSRVLQSLDPVQWTDDKVSALLQAADVNGDNRIQYEEFVGWVMGETAARRLAGEIDLEADAGSNDGQPFLASRQASGQEDQTEASVNGSVVKAFERFDANRDGVISRQELSALMKTLDPGAWNEDKVNKLLQAADTNQDGNIQYNEFVDWVLNKDTAQHLATTLASAPNRERRASELRRGRSCPALMDGDRESQIAEAFEQFDANQDGVISRSELATVMQSLNPVTWTDDNVNALLQAADVNCDGQIQYNEFISWAFQNAHSRTLSTQNSGHSFEIPSDELQLALSSEETLQRVQQRESDAVPISVFRMNRTTHTCRIWMSSPRIGRMYPCQGGGSILQMLGNARGAYAVLKADGSVITWGGADVGGDSVAVAEKLRFGVTTVVCTQSAFAALKEDGSVVCWGDGTYGGSAGQLSDLLTKGVQRLFCTSEAFSALKVDGSVVTWGNLLAGPEAEHLQGDVTDIASNHLAFAALKRDGSVVTWGSGPYAGANLGIVTNLGRGDMEALSVAEQLANGVTQIFSTSSAFAALKANGSVVAWGDAGWGGDSSAVAEHLACGVKQVFANDQAFAALKVDGAVITWGEFNAGGNSEHVAHRLSGGVETIVACSEAFAALKADGSVVSWGTASAGGDSSIVQSQLSSGVVGVASSAGAFAALRQDGSVVCWGRDEEIVGREDITQRIFVQVFSSEAAFAGLTQDGSVVTWGAKSCGGDAGLVSHLLADGVVDIITARQAFAAVKIDGSSAFWGSRIDDTAVARLQPTYAPVPAA